MKKSGAGRHCTEQSAGIAHRRARRSTECCRREWRSWRMITELEENSWMNIGQQWHTLCIILCKRVLLSSMPLIEPIIVSIVSGLRFIKKIMLTFEVSRHFYQGIRPILSLRLTCYIGRHNRTSAYILRDPFIQNLRLLTYANGTRLLQLHVKSFCEDYNGRIRSYFWKTLILNDSFTVMLVSQSQLYVVSWQRGGGGVIMTSAVARVYKKAWGFAQSWVQEQNPCSEIREAKPPGMKLTKFQHCYSTTVS